MVSLHDALIEMQRLAFCPTGEDGGVDPHCSPKNKGKGNPAPARPTSHLPLIANISKAMKVITEKLDPLQKSSWEKLHEQLRDADDHEIHNAAYNLHNQAHSRRIFKDMEAAGKITTSHHEEIVRALNDLQQHTSDLQEHTQQDAFFQPRLKRGEGHARATKAMANVAKAKEAYANARRELAHSHKAALREAKVAFDHMKITGDKAIESVGEIMEHIDGQDEPPEGDHIDAIREFNDNWEDASSTSERRDLLKALIPGLKKYDDVMVKDHIRSAHDAASKTYALLKRYAGARKELQTIKDAMEEME